MACATLKRSLDFDPVHNGRQSKRRRCSPLCVSPKASPSKPVEEQKPPSIFEQGTPALNPERMAADLRDEIRRLQRLNKLQIDSSEDSSKDSSSSQDSGPDSPGTSSTVRAPRVERPLYTMQQVEMICERMLREREAELREEYERILHMKLADQYEQFVKFTYDQLHRGFNNTEPPSYLS